MKSFFQKLRPGAAKQGPRPAALDSEEGTAQPPAAAHNSTSSITAGTPQRNPALVSPEKVKDLKKDKKRKKKRKKHHRHRHGDHADRQGVDGGPSTSDNDDDAALHQRTPASAAASANAAAAAAAVAAGTQETAASTSAVPLPSSSSSSSSSFSASSSRKSAPGGAAGAHLPGVESLSRSDLLGLSLKLSSQNGQLRSKQEATAKRARHAEKLAAACYQLVRDVCASLPAAASLHHTSATPSIFTSSVTADAAATAAVSVPPAEDSGVLPRAEAILNADAPDSQTHALEEARHVALGLGRRVAQSLESARKRELEWAEREAAYQASLQSANHALHHAQKQLDQLHKASPQPQPAHRVAQYAVVGSNASDMQSEGGTGDEGRLVTAGSAAVPSEEASGSVLGNAAADNHGCQDAQEDSISNTPQSQPEVESVPCADSVEQDGKPTVQEAGVVATVQSPTSLQRMREADAVDADATGSFAATPSNLENSSNGPAASSPEQPRAVATGTMAPPAAGATLRNEAAILQERHILVVEELKRTRLQAQQVTQDLAAQRSEADSLRSRVRELEAQIDAARCQLQDAREAAETADGRHEEQLVDLKLRLSTRTAELRRLKTDLDAERQAQHAHGRAEAEAEAQHTRAALREAEERLASEAEAGRDRIQQVNILSVRLADVNEQAEANAIEADNLRDRVAALQEEVQGHREATEREARVLQTRLNEQQAAVLTASAIATQWEDEAAEARSKAASAEASAASALKGREEEAAVVSEARAARARADDAAAQATEARVEAEEALRRGLAGLRRELEIRKTALRDAREEAAALRVEIASGKPEERKILALAREQAERDQRVVRQEEHLQKLHAQLVQVRVRHNRRGVVSFMFVNNPDGLFFNFVTPPPRAPAPAFARLQVSTACAKWQSKFKTLSAKYSQLRNTHSKHADAQHIKYVKNVLLRFLALHADSDTAKCANLIPLLAEMLEMTEAEQKTLSLSIQGP